MVDTRDLVVALKTAPEEVAACIFRNLSERARENLQEEIEFLRGVRKRDVLDAQKRIIDLVRGLEASGTIQIERAEGDDNE